MDITICVATCGEDWWEELAQTRAIPSAKAQGVPVVSTHYKRKGLAAARNGAIRKVKTEWLMFLDADDELAPGYVEAIASASGDLRVGSLIEVRPDGSRTRIRLERRHIERMNPCHTGTAIRADMMADVGGFPGLFPRWEDWAIFLRAFRRGATIEHVPEAEYLQHWRADSMVRTVADVCDPKQLHADIREWA